MNYDKWITHFSRNRENRPKQDWSAPVNASCLRAIGGSHGKFYSEVTRQLVRFMRSLRRVAKLSGVPALWAKSATTQLQPAK